MLVPNDEVEIDPNDQDAIPAPEQNTTAETPEKTTGIDPNGQDAILAPEQNTTAEKATEIDSTGEDIILVLVEDDSAEAPEKEVEQIYPRGEDISSVPDEAPKKKEKEPDLKKTQDDHRLF